MERMRILTRGNWLVMILLKQLSIEKIPLSIDIFYRRLYVGTINSSRSVCCCLCY